MNVFGPRIHIRPTRQDDLSFLRELWNDGTVMRYKGYPDGMHVTDACMQRWWIMTPQAQEAASDTSLTPPHCTMTLLDGTLIGEFAYSTDSQHRGHVDLKLAAKYWDHGYAVEALTVALRELFATAGIKCVVVEPSPANTRAHRLFARCGFHPAPTDNHPDRWECTRVDFADRQPLPTVAA